MEAALVAAIAGGVNVLDTSPRYRGGRSERVVGRAIASCGAPREALVIVTKAGPLPTFADAEARAAWIERELIAGGLATREQVHVSAEACFAPAWIQRSVHESRERIGVSTIDLVLLDDVAAGLGSGRRAGIERELREAFAALEALVRDGAVKAYGVSSALAFSTDRKHFVHLEIERLVQLARELAGDDHHLRALAVPYNLTALAAITELDQRLRGRWVSALGAARELGLCVLAAGAAAKNALNVSLPPSFEGGLPEHTSIERAIELVRSSPGVTTALVGLRAPEHATTLSRLMARPPVDEDAVMDLLLGG
jgi:aryl-alcohol dehydrogenase-like predicted oxidoreductase